MQADDPLPIDLTYAGTHPVIADFIMKPAQTRLLAHARERGLATQAGRHLLDHSVQAMAAFLGLVCG